MLTDYIFIIKESNHHNLTSRFDLSHFLERRRTLCFHAIITDLVRGSDANFYHMLLQSLGNSDHFETSVSTHNIGEFLFAFVF